MTNPKLDVDPIMIGEWKIGGERFWKAISNRASRPFNAPDSLLIVEPQMAVSVNGCPRWMHLRSGSDG